MNRFLISVTAAAAVLLIAGAAAPGVAHAKSDKAAKAQTQECKKLADPKLRDECVKKAGAASEKTGKAGKKSKEK